MDIWCTDATYVMLNHKMSLYVPFIDFYFLIVAKNAIFFAIFNGESRFFIF